MTLNAYQFLAILVALLGIFVPLIIAIVALFKFIRNSVTKDDLKSLKDDLENKIEALGSEMNRRFDQAAADRESIRAEAAVAREKIRDEAAADRERIRTELQDARRAIEGEISRQNQNYIEHLAYHT